MRAGFLQELRDVFCAAEAIQGAGDPAYIDENRREIEALRAELFDILGRYSLVEGVIGEALFEQARKALAVPK